MTLESVAITESSSARGFCSCCGAKIMPYFSDNAVASQNQINQLENFLTVKGAALFLPWGNGSSPSSAPCITQRRNKHTGDLQQHLQTMITLLRPEDTIRLAVRLESAYALRTRYMVIVSTNGRQDTEESVVLGMDFGESDSTCTVGLVLPLWSNTLIHLDGDGGFSVSTVNRVHVFKPVSVQAMWSALQSLHKVCEVARCHNYYPGSLFLTWVSYYQSRVTSDQHCINEWNAMQDVQSHRADSPVLFTDLPTERERTERLIKTRLREIMMQKDLENVTSKEIRTELEMQMVCNLREFKEFIDNEMIVILGQMDSPTEIFDHVYLGSEWNASNLEELQNSGVRYILNVTREIDNFFPGLFEYHNIRVYDEEATNLLEYWNDTYKFISKAKKAGVKCLVHCKMGVSRSASTVIAYAMKEYGWDLERAFYHVKERRSVTKPNPSFMKQLEEYQGILLASKQRHNKLWRSHSDGDLSQAHEPLCKAPRSLDRSDPHNNNSPPSIQQMLGIAVIESLTNPQSAPGNTHTKLGESPSKLAHEDPILPPRPRQRAATVVPEHNMARNSRLNLAVSKPIARRHLPPSLHVLSPEEGEGNTTTDLGAQSSHHVPEPKADCVELSPNTPDQNYSYQVSQTLELCLESAVGKDEGNLPSPSTPEADSPSGAPAAPGLDSSDDNNNPNTADLGTADDFVDAGVSCLGTDSIDFFSAREKFLCLSQDSQPARSFSETTAVWSPQFRCTPPLDDSSEEADECHAHSVTNSDAVPHLPHNDNSVCVRHIVTELESISHTCSPPLARNSPQTATLQEVDEESASVPHSPPDRPSGSVRRATEHLELILRQGQEVPSSRSPLPSPCLDCSEPHSSKPEGTAALTCTEPQKAPDGKLDGTKVLDDEDSGIIPDPSFSVYLEGSVSVEADQITLNPTLEPSSGSSSLLWLEGVTELETDVDDPLKPHVRLARSSEDLQKIQETLRELQAFLYEAGGLGLCTGQVEEDQSPEDKQDLIDGEQRLEPKAPAMWQRAMEIEARIRQAGLTPPSLMKRSASLAKLDRLELSTNDLSDWDFHPATTGFHQPSSSSLSTFDSLPLTHSHDDAHKKQRVLPQSPSAPESAVQVGRTEGSAHLSPSCPQQTQVGGASPPEHTPVQPTVSVSTRQQHVKTQPVRRFRKASDKKKTVTVLYNTM
ncbi:protein phosphatase Slingshot homolog 2-like isoform X2 [Sinocyclocheilus anshuiensis]|uniref:protein phosphatase Slingshot homolog 2-like isoform X2 n=1 Tax=Sinocyclocheilus anshuiensis TaxID=1608454 RepID=UPI0007B97EF6|nr:PREDICTED: protein phosphatase Slingshot homolog 2-like isoform X2 [Sinocyclocheilus anshuiensis]